MTNDSVPIEPLEPTCVIVAKRVAKGDRIHCLPTYFALRRMLLEQTVYQFMRGFTRSYRGGYWEFFELSNGGFYMTPDMPSPVMVRLSSDGFAAEMSTDAAGITACLLAYRHLSVRCQENDRFGTHYQRLLAFAQAHAEAAVIQEAID